MEVQFEMFNFVYCLMLPLFSSHVLFSIQFKRLDSISKKLPEVAYGILRKIRVPQSLPMRSERLTLASTGSPSMGFNSARRTGMLSSPSMSRVMLEAEPEKSG